MNTEQLENDVLYLILTGKKSKKRILPEYFKTKAYAEILRVIQANKNATMETLSLVGVKNIIVDADYDTEEYLEACIDKLKRNYVACRFEQFNKLVQADKANMAEIISFLNEIKTKESETVNATDFANELFEAFVLLGDDEHRNKNTVEAFEGFQKHFRSYQKGDLNIISAPTGVGKTSLALNIFADLICKNRKVCYVNTEMSNEEISAKLLSILTKNVDEINVNTINNGHVHKTRKLNDIAYKTFDKLAKSGMFYKLEPQLTLEGLKSLLKNGKEKGVEVFIVDYVGRYSTDYSKEFWLEFQNLAKVLKTVAQELNILIFLVSQVAKDGSLAMASYMEHEASIHFHVRKMTDKEIEQARSEGGGMWNYVIEIKKCRNGKTGLIPCKFIGEKSLFIFDREEASNEHHF